MAPRRRPKSDKDGKGMNRDERRKFQSDREKERAERVDRLLSTVVKRVGDSAGRSGIYDRDDALMELEEARMIALASYPPQISAAVSATVAKAKIMGLIVDRKQDLPPGKDPLSGNTEEQREQIMEELRERVGSKRAALFAEFMNNIEQAFNGGRTIEGSAEEIEDGDV